VPFAGEENWRDLLTVSQSPPLIALTLLYYEVKSETQPKRKPDTQQQKDPTHNTGGYTYS
jgi:hypothetical protein